MFASSSVSVHIARGVGGFTALALAMGLSSWVWPPLVLLPVGILLLRGCPMCWVVGLFQTLMGSGQAACPIEPSRRARLADGLARGSETASPVKQGS
jgi:hypothetical protein